MSFLVIEDLKHSSLGHVLEHEFRLSLSIRYNIGAFLPYLYMHNAPLGTFTFTIFKDGDTVFSKSFTSTDIKASMGTTDNYIYLWYPIVPDNPLFLESGLYVARFSSSGYVASGISYIGWIIEHENMVNQMDYEPSNDDENPLSFKIKVLKQGIQS